MVVVFGSINLDLVAQVARLPVAGETLHGQSFSAVPGGKGANQALAASRAGARVALFGAVGRDAFGTAVLANLESAGIDLSGVVAVDAATGVALIHVDAHGENAITVVAGANDRARADQVPASVLTEAGTLVVQLEMPVAEVTALARRAGGARVVLNAAPLGPLPEALPTLLDTLVVNETEAAGLAAAWRLPASAEAFAAAAAARCGCTVVVSLGAAGALAVSRDESVRIAAPRIRVIDATGAGDALVGAYAAALDRGAPLTQALREGVAAGSLACTVRGAQAGLPTASRIAELAATL